MAQTLKCLECGGKLAIAGKGRIPKFCSSRCRLIAHRRRHRTSIPAELREHPRWIRWIPVHRNGKETKVPITLTGSPASSTDRETWSTYSDARVSKVGDGLGFVLNGDGIMCIDLDHCVEDGVANDLALAFIAALPKTYIELSPSGDGLHIWGYGDVVAGTRRVIDGLHVETYSTGRYMTVTGQVFTKAPFAQLT